MLDKHIDKQSAYYIYKHVARLLPACALCSLSPTTQLDVWGKGWDKRGCWRLREQWQDQCTGSLYIMLWFLILDQYKTWISEYVSSAELPEE